MIPYIFSNKSKSQTIQNHQSIWKSRHYFIAVLRCNPVHDSKDFNAEQKWRTLSFLFLWLIILFRFDFLSGQIKSVQKFEKKQVNARVHKNEIFSRFFFFLFLYYKPNKRFHFVATAYRNKWFLRFCWFFIQQSIQRRSLVGSLQWKM